MTERLIYMDFNVKLELLIKRKGLKKVELAENVGITYRALANYLSGDRMPRKAILLKMAELLGVSDDFLLNETAVLKLDEVESFVMNASSDAEAVNTAEECLSGIKRLYTQNLLTDDDKRALFIALNEVYFSEN